MNNCEIKINMRIRFVCTVPNYTYYVLCNIDNCNILRLKSVTGKNGTGLRDASKYYFV